MNIKDIINLKENNQIEFKKAKGLMFLYIVRLFYKRRLFVFLEIYRRK